MVELTAWVAHRRRRITVRTATKNQLVGQVDHCFSRTGRVPDVDLDKLEHRCGHSPSSIRHILCIAVPSGEALWTAAA